METKDQPTPESLGNDTYGREAAINRRTSLSWLAAMAAPLSLGSQSAAAQTYPSGPITIIVPFPGGTPPDIYCRILGDRLSKRIGHPVVVDVRPGASSTIGAAYAAKARPDGLTMLYATNSTLTAAPGLFKKLPYDPTKDFSAVTVMMETYFGIIVRPEDSKLTVEGLAERIRKDPGRNAMAGGSVTTEVANKMFQNVAKLEHSYARYNSAQAYTDLSSGVLNAAWAPLGTAIALSKQGRVHILAVTSPQRIDVIPNTPTMSEFYPGFVLNSWSGFFVPSATPRSIVAQLYQHLAVVVRDEELQERGRQDGNKDLTMTPEQSEAYVKSDFPRWRTLLQNAGIQPA